MPELPDITVYKEALEKKLNGRTLQRVQVLSPFVLRTHTPALSEFSGKKVTGFSSLGKKIVWHFENESFFVLHLMIAGRLRWKNLTENLPRRLGLASFVFEHGQVFLTEAGTQKRASLHAVLGKKELKRYERAGIDPLSSAKKDFIEALSQRRHTIKRAMTDPDILSGIGNAYSDEILHRARLSPIKRTDRISEKEFGLLWKATKQVLKEWIVVLRKKAGEFPDKVTAFHEEMAVHGKYGQPCPDCQGIVQRIRYATNECNYCPNCQNGGKLLADRALSRLLKEDWPRTLEELEKLPKGS